MEPARLEAFTDGVVAIIITIMVLEIRVPQGADLAALRADVPLLLAYVLSYVNVGILWNPRQNWLDRTDERSDGDQEASKEICVLIMTEDSHSVPHMR